MKICWCIVLNVKVSDIHCSIGLYRWKYTDITGVCRTVSQQVVQLLILVNFQNTWGLHNDGTFLKSI